VIATKIALPETLAPQQGCGCLSIDACELLNPETTRRPKALRVRTTSNETAGVLTRPRTPERRALQAGFARQGEQVPARRLPESNRS
jgi:hypothetical protein